MEIRNDGEWNDTAESRIGNGYLVEYNIPEPAAPALLGLGAVAIMQRRGIARQRIVR